SSSLCDCKVREEWYAFLFESKVREDKAAVHIASRARADKAAATDRAADPMVSRTGTGGIRTAATR
ncbi:MAG: hypothetical protein LUI87_17025, partial [Lachnospiraceae bacterium]|nr:hypothetical protein [Lachnospiraceae bacterium]